MRLTGDGSINVLEECYSVVCKSDMWQDVFVSACRLIRYLMRAEGCV